MDWLEDSVSFLSSFLDETYCDYGGDIGGHQWWDDTQYVAQDLVVDHTPSCDAPTLNTTTTMTTTTAAATQPDPNAIQQQLPSNQSKKRKSRRGETGPSSRKGPGKANSNTNNYHNGNNSAAKEGRWAEQLLNPCAAAVAEGNFTRVQHLLYVLHELASLSGDANHRLAHHGLRALTHHISSSSSFATASPTAPAAAAAAATFAAAEPRFFQKSLIKFHEVSPWLAFPNAVANAAILNLLSQEKDRAHIRVHILDLGVSHGVQWPTLLEALTRRPGGPPPFVRITAVSDSRHNPDAAAFSVAPQGHDFSSRLLGFAKSLNLNLEISRLESHNNQMISDYVESEEGEALIICAQFRLHSLSQDERAEFLNWTRKMRPRGVILSENDAEGCSGGGGEEFGGRFSRRVERLWRFLESTSAAFKGRESEERRLVEGEAARGLTGGRAGEAEGKEGWCVRMRAAGFTAAALGEDAVDGGRALLRKYDGNWEMRVDHSDGSVGLWWKAQPVSFCSLWKLE